MKNEMLRLGGVFALIFFAVSCSDEPVSSPKSGGLNLYLDLRATIAEDGRVNNSDADDLQSVFISITDRQGNLVVERQMGLLKFNDHFVTETIILPEGDYDVTRFLVLGENNSVLLGAPMISSPGSHYIDEPLPVAFSVQGKTTSSVKLEVIPVDGRQPQFFGYPAFDFVIVYPCDKVTAIVNGQQWCGVANYIIAFGNTPPVFELLFKNGSSRFGIRTRYLGAGEYDLVGSATDFYKYGNNDVYDVVSGIMSITTAPVSGSEKVSGSFFVKLKNEEGDVIEITDGIFKDVSGQGY
jgi:hypothetical protein